MDRNEVIICKNESDIVDAIMRDEDVICIESSLGKKVSNIKNTGKSTIAPISDKIISISLLTKFLYILKLPTSIFLAVRM